MIFQLIFWLLCASALFIQIEATTTVDAIKQRGYLKCGVSTGLPGFSMINSSGQWQGFDVDFCRATAAAILNDSTKVEFIPLDSKSRFAALSAQEIDILIRNTTWNFTREASLNLLFPAVTFYDGQSILVRKDLHVNKISDLDSASICIIQGTTSEINLTTYFNTNNVTFQPIYFDRPEQMVRSYDAGRCDAMTSDRSQLFVLKSILRAPSEHIILDEVISKEPLAPVVRDDDVDFFKLIRWIVFSLIQAEEWGLTSENIQTEKRNNPDINKFLGRSRNVAQALGVSERFVVQMIQAVGNYGEIYDRNLGDSSTIGIQRQANALWSQNCGLMYALPSR